MKGNEMKLKECESVGIHEIFRTDSNVRNSKNKCTNSTPGDPKDPKMASHQESVSDPSKSELCAHTLHMCSSHKRFSSFKSEKMFLSRDRVQSISLWHHNFDFRSGFAIGFESTTKTQREAQKCQAECTIRALSRCL